MSNDPSPLKYMGTQSQETVNMAAAMARALGSTERAADQAMGKMTDDVSDAGRQLGKAANWAIDKAKDTLQSAAERVRARGTTVVATYTKEEPIRALLIAAGTGAVLMGLAAVLARSGVRTIERNLQR
jgi:ElaB/YqjD/DUF883 family membrane-anchored ribosome-binding protein